MRIGGQLTKRDLPVLAQELSRYSSQCIEQVRLLADGLMAAIKITSKLKNRYGETCRNSPGSPTSASSMPLAEPGHTFLIGLLDRGRRDYEYLEPWGRSCRLTTR